MKQYEVPSVEVTAFRTVETIANDDNYSENIQYGALISKEVNG